MAWAAQYVAVLILVGAIVGCEPTTLLCQRPEVLHEVEQIMRARNIYQDVDETTVTEAPTMRADAVVCHAAVTSIGYVPAKTGWHPRPVRTVRRYDVQVTSPFFFVQVPP